MAYRHEAVIACKLFILKAYFLTVMLICLIASEPQKEGNYKNKKKLKFQNASQQIFIHTLDLFVKVWFVPFKIQCDSIQSPNHEECMYLLYKVWMYNMKKHIDHNAHYDIHTEIQTISQTMS